MAKTYASIDLPPGMASNGTVYGNRGRWLDGSRVRWHNNAVRPIGGWQPMKTTAGDLNAIIADPIAEVARAVLGWKINSGSSYFAVGTNLGLYAFHKSSVSVFTITPADFTARPAGLASNDGYGAWDYGEETYGTERPYDEETVSAFSWCLRTWGQNLLAAPRGAPSKLYQWNLNTAQRAVAVPNAPTNFDCFHVTDQRIVMVAGTDADPRLVQWSDSENLTDWNFASVQNQAGFQNLPGIGRFKEIVTVQDQYLLVSETDAYVCRYLGPPYIFGFDQVGQHCGVVSGGAVVATEAFAIWPGKTDFFLFDGSSVNRLNCDVMDKFVNERNEGQFSKIVGFVNPNWPEVWWLYQTGGGDIDSYIFYDYKEGHWGIGKLNRSAGHGFNATGGLVMVSNADGKAYSHEINYIVPKEDTETEAVVFAESGPIELAGGNMTQYVRAIQPDFVSSGEVDVYLIGQDRPSGPETRFGPYPITYPAPSRQSVPCRARGHTVRLRIEGKDGTWTLGTMRLDLRTGGER